MRDIDQFELLLNKVRAFRENYDIDVPDMDHTYVIPSRARRNAPQESNSHLYHLDIFYSILDIQLLEPNSRFSVVNVELLLVVDCLSLDDNF